MTLQSMSPSSESCCVRFRKCPINLNLIQNTYNNQRILKQKNKTKNLRNSHIGRMKTV